MRNIVNKFFTISNYEVNKCGCLEGSVMSCINDYLAQEVTLNSFQQFKRNMLRTRSTGLFIPINFWTIKITQYNKVKIFLMAMFTCCLKLMY